MGGLSLALSLSLYVESVYMSVCESVYGVCVCKYIMAK